MKEYLRIAVTGGRNHENSQLVFDVLYNVKHSIETVGAKIFLIVGGARGADEQAEAWGVYNNVAMKVFHADWDRYGNSAGPARNRQMLMSGIDRLCAFPGGRGTSDMMKICKNTGVWVVEYKV